MDPLHAYARDGDIESIAKLLDQGSNINVKGIFLFLELVLEMI